jgi:hypothetical protein
MPEEQNKYCWVELAAKTPGGMARNVYARVDDPSRIQQWREEHRNTDLYTSICRFEAPDRQSAYCCDFFLDVDAPERSVALHEALEACQLLISRLGISPDSIDISFSGAKGFHMVVPHLVFGEPKGEDVIQVWYSLARRMAKEGLPHLDLTIYQKARLWRLVNSIHSSTGFHKVPVEYKELAHLGLEHVLDLAKHPREFDSMAVPERSDKAVAWFHNAMEWLKANRRHHPRHGRRFGEFGWSLPPCIRAIEKGTLIRDGTRHEVYFQYARFMATIGASTDEIHRRLVDINTRNPISDEKYIGRVARNAAKYAGFRTCPRNKLEAFCNPQECTWSQEAK